MAQYSFTTADDEERLSIEKELSIKSPRSRARRTIILGLIFSILGSIFSGISTLTGPSTYSSLLVIGGIISLAIAYFLDCQYSKDSVGNYRWVDIILLPFFFIYGFGFAIIYRDASIWQSLAMATMCTSLITMIFLIAGLLIVKSPFLSTQEKKSKKKLNIILMIVMILMIILVIIHISSMGVE